MLKYLLTFLCLSIIACAQQQPGVAFYDGVAVPEDTSTNIFVNSALGDDNNDGLTVNTPKFTPDSGFVLVNASTDTVFITGTFSNPFVITKNCGLEFTAIFYSDELTEYTFVAGSAGGAQIDTNWVTQSSDDYQRVSASSYWNYTYMNMGREYSNTIVATRFSNVLERANLDSSFIEYYCTNTYGVDTIRLRFHAENLNNPATYPAIYSEFDTRAANKILDSSYFGTYLTDWTAGQRYRFDITNLIDSLFNKFTYTGSQAVSILNYGSTSTSGAFRSASSYDNAGLSQAPILINYSSGTAQNAYYWKIVPDSVMQLFFGYTEGNLQTSKTNLDTLYEWYWSGDTLYIYGEALAVPPVLATVYVSADSLIQTVSEVNALETLVDGDIVAFDADEVFNGDQLIPKNGVTYTSFGSGRATIRLLSLTDYINYIIDARNTLNVNVKNLEIMGRYWADIRGSSHLTFDNLYFHHYNTTEDQYMPRDGSGLIKGDYSPNLFFTMKNCIAISGYPQTGSASDMITIWNSSYAWFERNFLMNSVHSIFGSGNSHHIGLLKNWMYNQYHHNLFLFQGTDSYWYVDSNYVQRSGNGHVGNDGGNNPIVYNGELGTFGIAVSNSQIRTNIILTGGLPRVNDRNWISPAAIRLQGAATNLRFVNNTIDSTYDTFGLGINPSGTQSLVDNFFINNAFTRVGDPTWYSIYGVRADSVALYYENSTTGTVSGNLIKNNYMFGYDSTIYQIGVSIGGPNSPAWSGFTFSNNIDASNSSGNNIPYSLPIDSLPNFKYWEPETNRGDIFDTLAAIYQPANVLIDAGDHWTQVNGSATGYSFVVDDSKIFFDGFNGWKSADSIAITRVSDGLTKIYARILSINYSTNTITTRESLTVYDNDYVDLYSYEGLKPNIGAIE